MMKFFRKHNKKLLAVFMALLMIVFLGGTALYDLAVPTGNRVVARTRLGPITQKDLQISRGTTEVLEMLNIPWFQLAGATQPIDEADWILLSREAADLGFHPEPAAVKATIAAQLDLNDLARRIRVRPDQILHALAQYNAIQQASQSVAGAAQFSEAELLALAHKALKEIRVNVVALPAQALADEDAEFSEEEIQAQFQQYREREPGPGLEFGYYVPPKVKVQYIRIDRDKLAENLRVLDLERKAKAYYEERPEQPAFRRPTTPEDEEGPEAPPYLTWDEAKDIAIRIVKRQEADKVAQRIANWLMEYALEPWLDVSRNEDGYRPAPEKVASLDYYAEIVDTLPEQIRYPEAISVGVTDFFGEKEAPEVPELGAASFRGEGGGAQTLRSIVFRSEATFPKVPDTPEARRADFLAQWETARFPLTNAEGDVFVTRIVEIQPGHIPESVDEVRDRVIADLRLKQGYENARWRAESLRSCEDVGGLKAAWELEVGLVQMEGSDKAGILGYYEPPPFSMASRWQLMSGRIPDTVHMGPTIGSVPREIGETCFALENSPEKVTVLELPRRALVLVVEFVEAIPASGEEFLEMRESFTQQLAQARTQDLISSWLDPEQIRARNGFTLVTN